MSNENETLLNKEAKVFCEFKQPIHVTYTDDTWNNGLIVEVREEFFMIDDFEDGLIPVFFAKVKKIEKYVPRREAKEC